MKNAKRIFALLIAMIMVLGMSTAVFAAGTGSITITPPTGTQSTTTNTYKIYKVFDADGDGTNISYKIISGKASSIVATDGLSKFEADAAGNVFYYERTSTTADWVVNTTQRQLSPAMVTAIGTYVGSDSEVATATSTGTADAVASNLPNGYYYITTSTGTVVTIDSTNPNAEVNDKNVVPPVTKTITAVEYGQLDAAGKAAVAQVGTTVDYTATVTVKAGMKNYVFHDTMSTGLALTGTPTVTASPAVPSSYGTWYTIKPTPDTGDSLTITFKDGLPVDTVITITYKATITADALTVDYAHNTAKVTYGDSNSSTSEPSTKVYFGQIEALKKDGKNTAATDDDTALSGAGFVLKNSDNKYYKLADGVVTWVDSIDNADVHTTGSDGKVPAFTGLGAGTYTLVEKVVPSGFNQAADVTGLVVPAPTTNASGEVTNVAALKVDAGTILNNKGTVLPTTGGIGTTVFYILGGLLIVGAGVTLIAKRRVRK